MIENVGVLEPVLVDQRGEQRVGVGAAGREPARRRRAERHQPIVEAAGHGADLGPVLAVDEEIERDEQGRRRREHDEKALLSHGPPSAIARPRRTVNRQ